MPSPKRERAARAVAGRYAVWRPSGRRRQADGGEGSVGFPGYPIGSLEHCWCGDMRDHDWPGKDVGAAHPAACAGENRP
jgi:hypothetical protein